MKRICTFLLFIAAIVSSVSADNGLYDGKYDRPTHFPDFQRPTGWPNNMSIFVQAMTAGGDTVSNYEVAVYDQKNKLRAIGRSRTADKQKCMLTVFGQEGDTFHFEVIYGDFDNPTIRPVNDTCVFKTNAVLGIEIDKPFRLTLAAAPVVAYWTDNVTALEPDALVAPDSADLSLLRQSVRIALRGSWKHESIACLLDSCRSLMILELGTLPDVTDGAFKGTNPNCLKYLPAGTVKAPDGWTNCIADGKALTDIVLEDGTSDYPYPFHNLSAIALNGHKAIYSRTDGWKYANGTSGWNTLVIPFDAELQADDAAVDVLPSFDLSKTENTPSWMKQAGYWICPFLYSTESEGLMFRTTLSDNVIRANTPYLFAMPGRNFVKTISGIDYSLSMEGRDIRFVSVGDSLPATPSSIVGSCESDYADWTDAHFTGTYRVLKQQPMSILKSQIADGYDAFVYYPKANLLPFRAYIDNFKGTPSKSLFRIDVSWTDNGATGFEEVTQDESASVMYDLSGRRIVDTHTQGTVIINRKIVYLGL